MDKNKDAGELVLVEEVEALLAMDARRNIDLWETFIFKVPQLCSLLRQQHKRIQGHEHWLDGLRAAWDIPKGTTIHEHMKSMALERDELRERYAKLESSARAVRAFCDNEFLVRREGCTDPACTGLICGPMKHFWWAIKTLDVMLTRPPPPTQP